MIKKAVLIIILHSLSNIFLMNFSANLKAKKPVSQVEQVKITILYDNYVFKEGTKAEWGFSCLIEGTEKTILFDTGGEEKILMGNMKRLNIDPKEVDLIVISHDHWDHTGGLLSVLKINPAPVYLHSSFSGKLMQEVKNTGSEIIEVNQPTEICKDVFSTGELDGPMHEQSLIVKTKKGPVLITGCSHPGIVKIVEKAKELAGEDIYLVFGGFHLMRQSDQEILSIIEEFRSMGVQKCGATHCTGDKQIEIFKTAYGKDYVEMGTGRVLNF